MQYRIRSYRLLKLYVSSSENYHKLYSFYICNATRFQWCFEQLLNVSNIWLKNFSLCIYQILFIFNAMAFELSLVETLLTLIEIFNVKFHVSIIFLCMARVRCAHSTLYRSKRIQIPWRKI